MHRKIMSVVSAADWNRYAHITNAKMETIEIAKCGIVNVYDSLDANRRVPNIVKR